MGSAKQSSDATRAERKAKKRKLEDAIPDLPGDLEAPQEFENADKLSKKRKRGGEEDGDALNGVKPEKDEKAAKKEKKRSKKEAAAQAFENGVGEKAVADKKQSKKAKKSNSTTDADTSADPVEVLEGSLGEDGVPKKSKKERKAERRAAEKAEATAGSSPDAVPESGSAPSMEGDKKSKKNNRNREKKRKVGSDSDASAKPNGQTAEGKAPRFIVFIGNLPFTATTDSIQKHFLAVKPKSIRHLTQKDNPSKSKGCAFIEFDGYDHMKTCLKLFHHSLFDDGVSPPRKINVELTAGGGGNTKDRKAKIGEKNQKLNEQRVRRLQEEEKTKGAKKDGLDEAAIHPSRRGRVPGAL